MPDQLPQLPEIASDIAHARESRRLGSAGEASAQGVAAADEFLELLVTTVGVHPSHRAQ
jgi:hypothetical protein